ncbi:glycosyltransferase family 2 protein [Nocardioides marmoraquaticus]
MPTPAEGDVGPLPASSAARVRLVVVNYGSHRLLERNLGPLTEDTPGLRTSVVDNLSTAAEREAVSRLASRHGWDLLAPDGNLGFGAGVNLALRRSPDEDVVVLLNPDASLTPGDLHRLVARALSHPDELVAPRLVRPDGTRVAHGSDVVLATGEMRGSHRRPVDADPASYQPWLSGACLAMSRALWDRAGGFDDDYFLYWEDVDLSRQVLAAGGRLELLQTASVVHDQGATHREQTSTREKSPTYYYWNARNRLVFASKHLSPTDQRRWLRTSPGAGYRLLLQGGRRQLRRPSRTVWPVLRGIRDGYRFMRRGGVG